MLILKHMSWNCAKKINPKNLNSPEKIFFTPLKTSRLGKLLENNNILRKKFHFLHFLIDSPNSTLSGYKQAFNYHLRFNEDIYRR